MPNSPARVLGRPIPLLVLAAAVLVGTCSGVGYAATRASVPVVRHGLDDDHDELALGRDDDS